MLSWVYYDVENMIIMMQLMEPLTGKTWKLEDFESYPAFLVTHEFLFLCHYGR